MKEYFNEEGVNVTPFLKSGRTRFMSDYREAMEYSLETKTYFYCVYDSQENLVGYGVPK